MKERGGEGEKKQRGRRAFIVHFKALSFLLPTLHQPEGTILSSPLSPLFPGGKVGISPLTQPKRRRGRGEKRRGRKRRCEQSISARRKERRGECGIGTMFERFCSERHDFRYSWMMSELKERFVNLRCVHGEFPTLPGHSLRHRPSVCSALLYIVTPFLSWDGI